MLALHDHAIFSPVEAMLEDCTTSMLPPEATFATAAKASKFFVRPDGDLVIRPALSFWLNESLVSLFSLGVPVGALLLLASFPSWIFAAILSPFVLFGLFILWVQSSAFAVHGRQVVISPRTSTVRARRSLRTGLIEGESKRQVVSFDDVCAVETLDVMHESSDGPDYLTTQVTLRLRGGERLLLANHGGSEQLKSLASEIGNLVGVPVENFSSGNAV